MNSALAALLPCLDWLALSTSPALPTVLALGPNAGHQLPHMSMCLPSERFVLQKVSKLCPSSPTSCKHLFLSCTGTRVLCQGVLGNSMEDLAPTTAPKRGTLCHRKRSHPEGAQRPNCLFEHKHPLLFPGRAPPLGTASLPLLAPPGTHTPRRPRRRSGVPGDPPLNAQSAEQAPFVCRAHAAAARPGKREAGTLGAQGHPLPILSSDGERALVPPARRQTHRDPPLRGPAARRGTRSGPPRPGPGSRPPAVALPGCKAGIRATFPAPPARPRCPRPGAGRGGPGGQPARLGAGTQPGAATQPGPPASQPRRDGGTGRAGSQSAR